MMKAHTPHPARSTRSEGASPRARFSPFASLPRLVCMMIAAGSLALGGCAGDTEQEPLDADTATVDADMDMPLQETATAQLSPTEGNDVTGTVTFVSVDGAVRVEADVQSLAPGMHGFHVHETGDCSAPDASSAGGHFNPEGTPHGAPDDAQRHVGDLGNIEAGPDSTAQYTRVDSLLTLTGTNSIVGKAVVVHGGQDDLTSQPSGDAGPRLACGVIEQM